MPEQYSLGLPAAKAGLSSFAVAVSANRPAGCSRAGAERSRCRTLTMSEWWTVVSSQLAVASQAGVSTARGNGYWAGPLQSLKISDEILV